MKTLLKRLSSILLLSALTTFSAYAAYPVGKLYTMSNSPAGNSILIFNRLSDGSLTQINQASTGGTGTGTGLGNQGALTVSEDGYFLFAVNAGNHTISSFQITTNGLHLVSTKSSGGTTPVSVAESHGRLFVLNAGNNTTPGNIKGFYVGTNGSLWAIPYATRELSNKTAGTGAAQISFSSNGRQLVVTEKATNLILTYHLHHNVIPSYPIMNNSLGATPFGFAVGKRDRLFVSNAEGGAANVSSLSSYKLKNDGSLTSITPALSAGETASCWVTLTPDERFAFTTNTGSGTISSYRINFNGALAVANNDAGITGNDSGPIDMTISPDSRFLYTLNAGTSTISAFAVSADGSLVSATTLTGIPAGANGLVAR